jgi:hypothetical protein
LSSACLSFLSIKCIVINKDEYGIQDLIDVPYIMSGWFKMLSDISAAGKINVGASGFINRQSRFTFEGIQN